MDSLAKKYTFFEEFQLSPAKAVDMPADESAQLPDQVVLDHFEEDSVSKVEEVNGEKKEDSSVDSTLTYLREIGKIPLLSPNEVVKFFRKIEEEEAIMGNLKKKFPGIVKPQSETENSQAFLEKEPVVKKWIERYAEAEAEISKIKSAVIQANLRLVVSIAKNYLNRGLSLLDLVQEGNLGLIRAIDKFDYHRGFRFSTYATWWIRQAILRAIQVHGKTIRIPVHVHERMNALVKKKMAYWEEKGKEPSQEEQSKMLDLSGKDLQDLLLASVHYLSLDSPVGDEKMTLMDAVEDIDSPSPIEKVIRNDLRAKVIRSLSTLTPREQKILRLRFGIDGGEAMTLERIGQHFNLTKERIRQIEGRALRRLSQLKRRKYIS
jgi:RNA polymerase primary sigma factor